LINKIKKALSQFQDCTTKYNRACFNANIRVSILINQYWNFNWGNRLDLTVKASEGGNVHNIKILTIVFLLFLSNFLCIPEFNDGGMETNADNLLEMKTPLENEQDSQESTRGVGARSIITTHGALGGSRLDTFEDESGLIWTPDFINLNVSEGELKLTGRNIGNSDFETGSVGSMPTDWFQESYFAGNGTSEHDIKLANDRFFEGSKSVYVFSKSISDGMPMNWRYAITNLTMNNYVNALGATYIEFYMSAITLDQSSGVWGYNSSIELAFDDGVSESSYLLFRQAIPASENAHNNVSSETGADGNLWNKYQVNIPGNLDKTHLKIKLRFTAGCRYHINGMYASVSANVDKIRFNIPETEFISQPIGIPTGMEWDSLMISTSQPLDTNINITILNATDEIKIPGSSTYSASYQYDISSVIDSKVYPQIKLKGNLKTAGDESPVLYCWGVSWKTNNTWRDTFFSGLKVDNSASVTVEDGQASFDNTGYMISKEISIPNSHYYDSLVINKTEPSDGTFEITVLDGKTDLPISNFDNLLESSIDLSGIDPHTHTSIKLKAEYTTTGSEPGILDGWAFNWTSNTGPIITAISSGTKVSVTKAETISINATDEEDIISDLVATVKYKGPSDLDWTNDYLSIPILNAGLWECTFSPPLEAETGYYSFNVEVADSFGFIYTYPVEYKIEVFHKILPEPEVEITPKSPFTTDDLSASIANLDVIDTQLDTGYELWYFWLKNNTPQSAFDNLSVIPNSETSRSDKWCCEVLVWDGEDKGPSGSAKVTVQNSVPELVGIFSSLTMYEDIPIILENKLTEIFNDADNDELTLSSTGGNRIVPEIFQDTGTIKLTSSANWFGSESITFTAADNEGSADTEVHISVEPTNDLPYFVRIGDINISTPEQELEFSINQDDTLELIILADDIDGDSKRGKLKFRTNLTNEDDFYFDEVETKIIFSPGNTDVGLYYVLVEVTDNNQTPVQYVPQLIKINAVNINDPPVVKITIPLSGATFSHGEKLSFNCTVEDEDLNLRNSSEWFIFRWFISSPDKKDLSQKQEVSDISLEPGKYTISVEVTDSGNLKSVDTVEITVEDSKSSSASSIAANNQLLILALLVIIVVIIVLFLVLKKRKKKEEEKSGAETAITGSTVSGPTAMKPKPQLPALQKASVDPRAVAIAKQKLEQLEAQYKQGTVDHLTYINLKEKYELEANPVMVQKPKEIPQLPPAKAEGTGPQPSPSPSPVPSPAPAKVQPVPTPAVQPPQAGPGSEPAGDQPKGPKVALPGQNNNKN
jgi:hypothetical protein